MIRSIYIYAALALIFILGTDAFAQTLQSTTDYRIIAYMRGGEHVKSRSNTVEMVRFSKMYIPNTFTPNGDELNDQFKAICGELSAFSMLIFNKWGQLLYETDDVNKPWDGKYEGKIVKEGSYVYKISARGSSEGAIEKSGTVTVLL